MAAGAVPAGLDDMHAEMLFAKPKEPAVRIWRCGFFALDGDPVGARAAAIPATACSGTVARGPCRSVTKVRNLAVLVWRGTPASRGEGAIWGVTTHRDPG
jgi:hypothetical protein